MCVMAFATCNDRSVWPSAIRHFILISGVIMVCVWRSVILYIYGESETKRLVERGLWSRVACGSSCGTNGL